MTMPDPRDALSVALAKEMDLRHFKDDRHALYAGWIAGIAMRNGYKVEIITDGPDFTDKIILHLPALANQSGPKATTARVFLAVPYPPDDWTFE